jgi:hypothetical protein
VVLIICEIQSTRLAHSHSSCVETHMRQENIFVTQCMLCTGCDNQPSSVFLDGDGDDPCKYSNIQRTARTNTFERVVNVSTVQQIKKYSHQGIINSSIVVQ